MRTSTGVSAVSPMRLTRFSWITRNSLTCIDSGRSATSSRNRVPPFAAWKKPSRSLSAPVKAPLAVAEELAFHEVLGDGPAVHRDERMLGARPDSWIRRAARSLPLPDSPEICTAAWLRASFAIMLRTCSIAGNRQAKCWTASPRHAPRRPVPGTPTSPAPAAGPVKPAWRDSRRHPP